MDLHAARLQDWRSRDGYGPIRYLSARRPLNDPTGPVITDDSKAMDVMARRRNLTTREKAASGGVYFGGQQIWKVPVEVLPVKFQLKPADVIVDRDGHKHTVQSTDLINERTEWRLETLDLVLAYDLRDTVNIERATISNSPAGAYLKAFASGPPPNGGEVIYNGLAARVQLVTQEVNDQRGLRAFLGNYLIIVSRQVSVTNEDRVFWTDSGGVVRYFDIKGYHNAQRIDELPVLDVELRP
jgi:hypothetical protein